MVRGMALHEQSVGASDEWYTPPRVFEALGCCLFDIDVASPGQAVTPWIPALHFLTHDSLSMKWNGYVWMNAPFGAAVGPSGSQSEGESAIVCALTLYRRAWPLLPPLTQTPFGRGKTVESS
jgi:hypothetical protein